MNADVDASNEAPAASLKQKSSSLASADDPEKEAEKEQNVHPVQSVVDVEKVPESRYGFSCNQIGGIETRNYFKSLYKVVEVEFGLKGFATIFQKFKTEAGKVSQLKDLALTRIQQIENFNRADFIKNLLIIEEVFWKQIASVLQEFEPNMEVFNTEFHVILDQFLEMVSRFYRSVVLLIRAMEKIVEKLLKGRRADEAGNGSLHEVCKYFANKFAEKPNDLMEAVLIALKSFKTIEENRDMLNSVDKLVGHLISCFGNCRNAILFDFPWLEWEYRSFQHLL